MKKHIHCDKIRRYKPHVIASDETCKNMHLKGNTINLLLVSWHSFKAISRYLSKAANFEISEENFICSQLEVNAYTYTDTNILPQN